MRAVRVRSSRMPMCGLFRFVQLIVGVPLFNLLSSVVIVRDMTVYRRALYT